MSNIAVKWTGQGSQMFIGRDSFGHVVVSGSWPQEDESWQEWKGWNGLLNFQKNGIVLWQQPFGALPG